MSKHDITVLVEVTQQKNMIAYNCKTEYNILLGIILESTQPDDITSDRGFRFINILSEGR